MLYIYDIQFVPRIILHWSFIANTFSRRQSRSSLVTRSGAPSRTTICQMNCTFEGEPPYACLIRTQKMRQTRDARKRGLSRPRSVRRQSRRASETGLALRQLEFHHLAFRILCRGFCAHAKVKNVPKQPSTHIPHRVHSGSSMARVPRLTYC